MILRFRLSACSFRRKRSWIIYCWLVWYKRKNTVLAYNPRSYTSKRTSCMSLPTSKMGLQYRQPDYSLKDWRTPKASYSQLLLHNMCTKYSTPSCKKLPGKKAQYTYSCSSRSYRCYHFNNSSHQSLLLHYTHISLQQAKQCRPAG